MAALVLVSGETFLQVFSRSELDALAYFFLRLHGRGITIAAIFWGLWLFPFGLAVIRSGFIPKIFGYLLIVAGGAYVVDSFVTLVLPQFRDLVSPIAGILAIAELPILLWLVIAGARTAPGEGDG